MEPLSLQQLHIVDETGKILLRLSGSNGRLTIAGSGANETQFSLSASAEQPIILAISKAFGRQGSISISIGNGQPGPLITLRKSDGAIGLVIQEVDGKIITSTEP